MLRLWLPLNGDLHNQGLDDVTVTNNGATVNNAGKIGKCYEFNGSSYMKVSLQNLSEYSTTACSMCVWAKFPSASSGNKQLLNIGTSSGWNNIRFGILYQTGAAKVLTSISDGSSNYVTYSCNANITENEWNHVTAVYNNRILKIYINGVLANTFTTTYDISFTGITELGIGAAPNGAEKFTGSLCDVRVYSHALSAKEVKELSKGLVCHYTLSGGGENLATNSADLTKWTKESGVTCTWDSNKQMYKVQSTSTSSRWGIWQQISCDPNTTYTFSVEGVKTDQNMFLSVGSMASGAWPTNYDAFTTERKRLSYTWTTGSDHTVIRMYLAIYPTADGSKTGYYALPKLEKGSVTTPWTPNPEDSEYTKMGFDDGIEYDVSGYGNNGDIIGTLTYTSDTPRYNTATYFNGSSYIKTLSGELTWNNFELLTISAWMKPTTTPASWVGSIGISYDASSSAYKTFSINNYGGKFTVSTADGGWVNTQSTYVMPLNEWHHYAATLNGTTVNMYVDGELIKTATLDWKSTTLHPNPQIEIGVDLPGSDEIYTGYYSDVRIYSTCLSQDDILALYNTTTSIASNGTLMTQGEIVEV